MANTEYGIIKATTADKRSHRGNWIRPRDLLKVPHKNKTLVLGYPAFSNIDEIVETQNEYNVYSHSEQLSRIKFKPATISESISAIAYNFENEAKVKVLGRKADYDRASFELGSIVRPKKGFL